MSFTNNITANSNHPPLLNTPQPNVEHSDDAPTDGIRIWTVSERSASGNFTINPFHSFHSDILLHIFSCLQLDTPRDTQALALTDRHFCQFISNCVPLWRSLLERHFPDSCANSQLHPREFCKHLTITGRNIRKGEYTTHTLVGHKNPVGKLLVHGELLCSASQDGTIKIWDVNTRKELQTLTGHQVGVTFLLGYEDLLFSGSQDGDIKIWDIKSGTELKTLKGHRDIISRLVIHDHRLYSISFDHTLRIWDIENRKELQTIENNAGSDLLIHGNFFYSTSKENWSIKSWDLKSGKEFQTFETLCGRTIASSHLVIHGDYLYSSTFDRAIYVWDLKSGKQLQTLDGPRARGMIVGLEIHGDCLYSISSYGFVNIWNLKSRELVRSLYAGDGCTPRSQVHEGFFYSQSMDGLLSIWDTKNGVELQTLKTLGEIDSIAHHRGCLYAASSDGTIKILDFNSPALSPEAKKSPKVNLPLLGIKAHTGDVRHIANIEKPVAMPRQGQHQKEYSPLLLKYSKILERTPAFLQTIGLRFSADFEIFCSPDLQKLPVNIQEAKTRNERQTQGIANKNAISKLLKTLSETASKRARETEYCTVLLYEVANPWVTFQKELNAFQAEFKEIENQCAFPNVLLSTFSPESYGKIAKKVNALIDSFEALDHAQLHAYVTQWGILHVWEKELNPQEIFSLKKLLKTDNAPKDLFHMGT